MDALSEFMGRVQAAAISIEGLVVTMAFLGGVTAIFSGSRRIAQTGGSGGGDVFDRDRSIAITLLLGGTFLLAFPAFLSASGFTLFEEAAPPSMEIFAYAPELLRPVNTDEARLILFACLTIVQVIGAIGIFRAILLFMRAPYHPGMGLYGRAIVHVVGGTLAVNIVVFASYIEQLFLG